jgi:hypothetical protein
MGFKLREMFLKPRRPKNLGFKPAGKISFDLTQQKTDHAFGNKRFFVGQWSAKSSEYWIPGLSRNDGRDTEALLFAGLALAQLSRTLPSKQKLRRIKMESGQQTPSRDQKIFDLKLPTETISLYLLCCGIKDAGITLTNKKHSGAMERLRRSF